MLFNRSANSSDCSQFIPKRIKLCITKCWEAGNRKLKRVLKIIFKNEKKLFILYSTRNDGTLEYRINGYIGITVLSMEFLQNHKSPGHNNCPNCDI